MDEQITLGCAADLQPVCGEPEFSGDVHGLAVAFMNIRLGSASITGPAACVRPNMYRVIEGVSRLPDTPRSPHPPGD
jgi:hypothetical protein